MADIAFIPFEIFVAFVQALVFSLLTLVFLQIATSSHEGHESEHNVHEEVEHQIETQQAATTH